MIAALKADEIAAIVFADIAIVVVVARLMGAAFRRIRQPAVVGEIIAGILLGPSLLGLLPGEIPGRLFPTDVRPFLNVVAQLGLIIFMFIVGLELDINLIRGKERTAAAISVSSVALPFGLGFLLASYLHRSHDVVQVTGRPTGVDFLPFALFIGASMSVTAFPVLARILTERRMYRTEIGALVLACAAVDDILAWSLLAVVLAVVASTGILDLPLILVESLLFVAFMFVVVRPRLATLAARYRQAGRLTPDVLAVVLVGILLSAFVTSKIGIHSIFGAFLFGVVMPREETADFFHAILERLEQVSVLLLLPVFFIVTGLEVDVRGLGRDALTQLPVILAVACIGKFVGASLAARLQGIPSHKSAAIGILMNTRGLTELVILNVGRSFGVLDDRLFTMLVVMAVVTTVITEPLLRVVYPDRRLARDIAEAERQALGTVDAFRVLAVADDAEVGRRLVDTAVAIVGDDRPAEVVLGRFSPARNRLEIGGGLVTELSELTTSLEELRALARRAEDQGVSCQVRAQFTDDPSRDILVAAAALGVDLLLVAAESDGDGGDGAVTLPGALRDAPCTVVAVADRAGRGLGTGPDHPVLVHAAEGPGGGATVELALRLALSCRAEMRLVAPDGRRASRRVAAWVQQARRAGVACSTTRTADLGRDEAIGAVLATDLDSHEDRREAPMAELIRRASSPVLLVRAGAEEDDAGVERFVTRRLQGSSTASTPSPVENVEGGSHASIQEGRQ